MQQAKGHLRFNSIKILFVDLHECSPFADKKISPLSLSCLYMSKEMIFSLTVSLSGLGIFLRIWHIHRNDYVAFSQILFFFKTVFVNSFVTFHRSELK